MAYSRATDVVNRQMATYHQTEKLVEEGELTSDQAATVIITSALKSIDASLAMLVDLYARCHGTEIKVKGEIRNDT